jgi:hypothetical protein
MKKDNRNGKRKIYAALLIAALAILAAIFFFGDGLGILLRGGSEAEEFFHNADTSAAFAGVDRSLAVASGAGLQLYDRGGELLIDEKLSFKSPAINTGGDCAVAYDIKGGEVLVFDGGGVLGRIECDTEIISATVNENGFVAVSAQEPGYKGAVTVYDSNFDDVYKWYSGEGYLLRAAVSPDNSEMAALTLREGGSNIVFYGLKSEAERASYFTDGIVIEIGYLQNGRIYALAENSLLIISNKGDLIEYYEFPDKYLRHFAVNEKNGYIVLAIYENSVSQHGQIVCIGKSGGVLGSADVDDRVLSLSAEGNYIAALYKEKIAVYDKGLKIVNTFENNSNASKVIMEKDKALLALAPFSAKRYKA